MSKNQARVHTEAKFGYLINPYTSTAEATTTFPTTAAAVGLRPGYTKLEICDRYRRKLMFTVTAKLETSCCLGRIGIFFER
jgi:hypothetical protein